jgi:hypothetical protein
MPGNFLRQTPHEKMMEDAQVLDDLISGVDNHVLKTGVKIGEAATLFANDFIARDEPDLTTEQYIEEMYALIAANNETVKTGDL